ncbi:MAG: HD-GYP domain-containing protein [Thalassotalea sp.]
MNKQTVLVVDDTPENIDILAGILKDEFKIKVAISGERALEIASSEQAPDIILLDVMMPGMDGWEVCKRLKSNFKTRHIPVIFITAKMEISDELEGFELGAADYITKPVSPPVVKARVRTHLALHDQNRELERKVVERTKQLHQTRLQVVQRLGQAAEFKDNETGMHVLRMSHYSHILALEVGMDPIEAELLLHASPMHDIGKIGIPDRVLQKPGKLDAEEWNIMQTHAEIGAKILTGDDSELLKMAYVVALTHHEKWDGSGYPNGLQGEKIPLVGRIVAVADVFDALTSKRPYKEAWTVADALSFLNDNANKHFDPELVGAFNRCLPQILKIKDTYCEE